MTNSSHKLSHPSYQSYLKLKYFPAASFPTFQTLTFLKIFQPVSLLVTSTFQPPPPLSTLSFPLPPPPFVWSHFSYHTVHLPTLIWLSYHSPSFLHLCAVSPALALVLPSFFRLRTVPPACLWLRKAARSHPTSHMNSRFLNWKQRKLIGRPAGDAD